MQEQYVDKVPTVALLTLGGLFEEEILTYPEITTEDLAEARKLLSRRGWSIGKCERCDKISWIRTVAYETRTEIFNAKLCGDCTRVIEKYFEKKVKAERREART